MANASKSQKILWLLVVLLVIAGATLTVSNWWRAPAPDTTNTGGSTGNKSSVSESESETPKGLHEFTSAKGVVIKLADIKPGSRVTSPLTITGEVPGNWSNEGQFTIELSYGGEDLIGVGSGTATLSGDWQTTSYVPFSATINFTPPPDSDNGNLVIRRANPSGLPTNDDSVSLAIKF